MDKPIKPMTEHFIRERIDECKNLWSRYSCDCLHYELLYWENELKKI